MEGVTLWEGNSCPLCETQGINSKLKFFRLNLRAAALLCPHKKCPFPLSTNYPDTFVRVGRDGKIIPGSQSERGVPYEEEDDSDDSTYISDTSEDSVTFPDIVPEVKNLHNVSSVNTNKKGASEVDAFDISSIDFETDDSMDTFKLRNEITALEKEITKSVENMKSIPLQVIAKDSSLFNNNSEKCKNAISLTDKEYTTSTKQHRESDINDSSCVKTDQKRVECCNDRKSGNIILYEQESSTSIPGSLEHTNTSDESANCKQQLKVNTSVSNKSISNHKHADVQNNSNRNCQDTDCSDDGNVLQGAKSIINGNYIESHLEKQHDIFSMTNISNPEPKPSVLSSPENTKKNTGNDLISRCELLTELVTSKSVTIMKGNDCGKKLCGNKEIVIDYPSEIKVEKQLDSVSMPYTSNPEPKPLLLNPQSTKNATGNYLLRKHELHAKLASSESATIKKDNDCGKEMFSDAHEDNDFSDNTTEKQFGIFSMADSSNPEPKPLLSLPPQSNKNTIKNNLSRKRDLQTESVSCELVPFKKGYDCGKKKYNDKGMDIIYDERSKSYEIVTIDSNTSSTGFSQDSKDCEIIDLEVNFCKIQNSSGTIVGIKTTKVHHCSQNTIEKRGSNLESVTPVKLKVVEKDGQFVCTPNNSPSSVSEVEEVKELQKHPARNKVHSKNCVCFLCKESTRGITSHLDRALADIFPEEHTVVKNLTEKELPTETEIMKDFLHYMSGNTKTSPKVIKKKKRLFHL